MSPDRDEAARRGWSNRSLVLETERHRLRKLCSTVLISAVAFAPTGIYLVEQNEYRKVSYELTELQVAQEKLLKQERELTAERTRLESLSEIETWAARERALRRPVPEQVVVVRSDRLEESELLARAPRGAEVGSRD